MHRRRWSALVAFAAVGSIAAGTPSAVARVFPLTDVLSMSAEGDFDASGIDVVATEDGFLAAWTNFLGTDISVVCFDESGHIVRGPRVVPADDLSVDSESISISSDLSSAVVLAWVESDPYSYSEPGVVAAAKLQAACGAPDWQVTLADPARAPQVAMSADGSFLATWEVKDASGVTRHARFFDSAGNASGREIVAIDTDDFGTEWAPRASVASIRPDEYVVVWNRYDAAQGDRSFVGRTLTRLHGASAMFPVVPQGEVPGYWMFDKNTRSSLTAAGEGRFLFAWTESRRPPEWWWYDGRSDVFAKHIGPSGAPLGPPIQVTDAATTEIYEFDDVDGGADAAGFVVSWTSYYTSPAGYSRVSRAARDAVYSGTDAILAARYATADLAREDFEVAPPLPELPSVRQYPLRPSGSRLAGRGDGIFAIVWQGFTRAQGEGAYARVFCDDAGTDLACGTTRCQSVSRNGAATTLPTARDALVILRGALGLVPCAPCACDVDATSTVTASDAARVLQRAIGNDVALACSPC